MTMASSNLNEKKKTKDSILAKVLTHILHGRTKTVLNALKDAPELKKAGKDMHDAFVKFNKSLEKASKSNQSELEKLRPKR